MKYKLLKDLPGFEAGTVFTDEDIEGSFYPEGESLSRTYVDLLLKDRWPDWFEPVEEKPTRWRPRPADSFYWIEFDEKLDATVESGDAANLSDDDLNVFRTEEQAQAVADAIKALLEYVHRPEKDITPADDPYHHMERSGRMARKAVQNQ